MNEIDRDINEEYVNFKLKLEISKMVTVDKIFTKKWLFVVDEVLSLFHPALVALVWNDPNGW